MSAIARRRLAYPAFFALALAACSGRRGTGADSAPPPDGDLDVPVPEPADAPAVVESADTPADDPPSDPVPAAEPRGDPAAERDLPRFECSARLTPGRPSLDTQPRILWRAPIPRTPPADGIAVTRDRVSVAAGASAFIYDRQGNLKTQYTTQQFIPIAGVVADAEGNFYYAGGEAFSLSGSGELRWIIGLRPGRIGPPSVFALSPDGVLYSMQQDNRLRAFEKDTGRELWAITFPPGEGEPWGNAVRSVVAGYRDLLVVQLNEWGLRIFDRRTGKQLATIPGTYPFAAFGASGDFGIFAGPTGGPGDTLHSSRLTVYGFDGVFRWAVTGNRLSKPAFVDLLGRLVVSEFEPPGFPRLVRYSCEGQRVDEAPFPLDPAKRPVTTEDSLLGADGVAYVTTFTRVGLANATHDLVALDRDFRQLWRMSFPAEIARGSALSDDGVLYISVRSTQPELIAIQTTSPGPAKTSWPSMRNNYFLGGWLAEYTGP